MDRFSAVQATSLTQSGSLLGSPYYMSPEQAKGAKHIDHRADVWSLGIVLYEALAGVTPFAEYETLGSLIIAICSQHPRSLQERAPWVGPDVAAIVHRALAYDADHRFQSISEMLTAIRALLPAGHAVHQAMLVPLSLDARRVIATRLSEERAPLPYRTTTARLPIASGSGAVTTATAGGVETPRRQATRSRSMWPLIAVFVACLGAGALATRGALQRLRSGTDTAPASAAQGEPSGARPQPPRARLRRAPSS